MYNGERGCEGLGEVTQKGAQGEKGEEEDTFRP